MSLVRLDKAYCLQLANGHGWNLIATEGTEPWVDRLASIMELKPCEVNGYPKLIFTREELSKEKYEEPVYALDPDIRRFLPGDGWKTNNYASADPISNIQFWYHNSVPDAICYIGRDEYHDNDENEDKDAIKMWSSVYFIYHWEQHSGGLPFHAGLVERNGRSVLLSANGGTGKSTCCRRIPSPWHALADDQTLIVRDEQGKYMVHPFPTWSEYLWRTAARTWNVERHVSLSAIFFIQRAKSDEVIPIKQGKAAILINESAMQACAVGQLNLNKEDQTSLRTRIFSNSCELAKAIPAYILRVSLNGRFWEEIEKVL